MKDTIYKMILASIVRGLLFMAAGFLIQHNIVAAERLDEFLDGTSQIIAAIVIALLGLAWTSKDKIRSRVMLKLAVDAAPPNVTVETVQKIAEQIPLTEKVKIAAQGDTPTTNNKGS